jgi:Na+-transporting methylmalonyl-CoA/oxaloacetate decarboxylase gamma subunit
LFFCQFPDIHLILRGITMYPAIATVIEGATAIGSGVALTATGLATGTLQVIGGFVVVTQVGRFIKRTYNAHKAAQEPTAMPVRKPTAKKAGAKKPVIKTGATKATKKQVAEHQAKRRRVSGVK